jgi:predicted DNA-binding transcriptional regulator YafY
MKSQLFSSAIMNRNRVRFLYKLNEVVLDPYYITVEKTGKKVIYGRMYNSNEIRKFEYDRIANIRILNTRRFSPIIPLMPRAV